MKNEKNIIGNLIECVSILATGTEYDKFHVEGILEDVLEEIKSDAHRTGAVQFHHLAHLGMVVANFSEMLGSKPDPDPDPDPTPCPDTTL